MKKTIFLMCFCLLGIETMLADEPLLIELREVGVYNRGNPTPTHTRPLCPSCFTATIDGNLLNVINDSDETINLVVTDLTTNNVVLSTPVVSYTQNVISEGQYKLEILPTTYAPMEGWFDVEE